MKIEPSSSILVLVNIFKKTSGKNENYTNIFDFYFWQMVSDNHLARQKSNMLILFPFWMEVFDKLSFETKLQQFSQFWLGMNILEECSPKPRLDEGI
jgi:hypothetical protein